MRILALLLLCLSYGACYAGDIASSSDDTTHDQSVDNSVDNSTNGISQCTTETHEECTEEAPGEFSTSTVCSNATGQPVTLSGPEPVGFCPTPLEEVATQEEPSAPEAPGGSSGDGLDQATPS